jgi:hypothetical protein
MARQAVGLAVAAALVVASGAGATHGRPAAFPFLKGFHFTGTPLALEFFQDDKGQPVAVMFQYNRKGIVPGSYAGVITRCSDIVARANANRQIEPVGTLARAGWCQDFPDPYDYLNKLVLSQPTGLTEEPAKTFYEEPGTSTVFYFFVNETSGALKLVSNPEDFSTKTLIPGATAFQLSARIFEIYPIGPNGHTSSDTKLPDLPQPPLTPSLDAMAGTIELAKGYESQALVALAHGHETTFAKLVRRGKDALERADRELDAASGAGEVAEGPTRALDGAVGDAHANDYGALHPESEPGLKGKSRARIRQARKAFVEHANNNKKTALFIIARQKAARQTGK